MRIAIFTDAYLPQVSGVITSVCMLKEGLERLGHEVYIITTEVPKKYTEIIEENRVIRFRGFEIKLKSLRGYKISTFLGKKLKILKKYNFDIVHVHTEFTMGRMGCLFSHKYDIPMVYTFHTNYQDYLHYFGKVLSVVAKPMIMLALKQVIKYYVRHSNEIIVPTKKVEQIFRNYGIDHKLNIIPTGINISNFYEENINQHAVQEIKDKYELNGNIVFISLGRIAVEKSINVLIEQFAQLDKNLNAKLLIVGGGPDEKKLKKLVSDLAMNEKIIFTGMVPQEEVCNYYHTADVFLNASRTETQGLTYIEALASELVVLVRDDLAIEDLVINDFNGFKFNENNELKYYMNKIITDHQNIENMRQNTRKSVAKYSKECYTNNALNLYKHILNRE